MTALLIFIIAWIIWAILCITLARKHGVRPTEHEGDTDYSYMDNLRRRKRNSPQYSDRYDNIYYRSDR